MLLCLEAPLEIEVVQGPSRAHNRHDKRGFSMPTCSKHSPLGTTNQFCFGQTAVMIPIPIESNRVIVTLLFSSGTCNIYIYIYIYIFIESITSVAILAQAISCSSNSSSLGNLSQWSLVLLSFKRLGQSVPLKSTRTRIIFVRKSCPGHMGRIVHLERHSLLHLQQHHLLCSKQVCGSPLVPLQRGMLHWSTLHLLACLLGPSAAALSAKRVKM